MTTGITVEGVAQWRKNTDKMSAEALARVRVSIFRSALKMQGLMIKEIAYGSKTGEIYTRGDTSHQASAPGEAPATEPAAWDGGQLVAGIVVEREDGGDVVNVRSKAPYSMDLEFGTEHMEPRPFMAPAFRAVLPDAKSDAKNAAKWEA